MNAQEADIVAGIINNSIGRPVVLAAAANIGSSKVVVARFEFSSVKNVTDVQISKIIKNGLKSLMPELKA